MGRSDRSHRFASASQVYGGCFRAVSLTCPQDIDTQLTDQAIRPRSNTRPTDSLEAGASARPFAVSTRHIPQNHHNWAKAPPRVAASVPLGLVTSIAATPHSRCHSGRTDTNATRIWIGALNSRRPHSPGALCIWPPKTASAQYQAVLPPAKLRAANQINHNPSFVAKTAKSAFSGEPA